MQYLATAQTDAGIERRINQDSLMIKVAQTPKGEIVMAVICDGMGGLKLGEVASASVITAFAKWFYEEMAVFTRKTVHKKEVKRQLTEIILSENRKLMQYGRKKGLMLGTTVTALLMWQDMYYVAHVGDCRLYEITDCARQLTRDHTYVAREVALGNMDMRQAQTDSKKNVLLQCVGVNATVEPDFFYGRVIPDATYLLCSDGFRHEILEKEISEYCSPVQNRDINKMQQTLQYLIELNKKRQEKDNISAIFIRSVE